MIRGHFRTAVSYLPHVKKPALKGHLSCRDTFSGIWRCLLKTGFISSAVPPGSGAFQMPTCPSSSAASASTLRGGRANLRNASVTFSLFLHEASLG